MPIPNDNAQNRPFCRLQLVVELERLDTTLNEPTNKSSIKVLMFVKPTNKKTVKRQSSN